MTDEQIMAEIAVRPWVAEILRLYPPDYMDARSRFWSWQYGEGKSRLVADTWSNNGNGLVFYRYSPTGETLWREPVERGSKLPAKVLAVLNLPYLCESGV